MGWRRGSRNGPWPGRGPFSYLPPWQRPGWIYGRGACWWLLDPKLQSTIQQAQPPTIQPSVAPMLTREQEHEMLKQQEKFITTQLEAIRKRLDDLSKET